MGRTVDFSLVRSAHANFNSLAPCGANPFLFPDGSRHSAFQLTRPVWGEPYVEILSSVAFANFNSLAPCGANPIYAYLESPSIPFQLTRPVWGEPLIAHKNIEHLSISTHSPRVGRTNRRISGHTGDTISTHSPRVGRTRQLNASYEYRIGISTHSPRVGRTSLTSCYALVVNDFNSLAPCGANRSCRHTCLPYNKFQLTRPVWGEPLCRIRPKYERNFNSLAPCGANQEAKWNTIA